MEIKTFNLTYFLLLAFIAGAIIFFSLYMKKRSLFDKKCLIFCICLFNLILFFFYKIGLYVGHEELTSRGYEFDIWLELPLQLCNISLFLVPIGILLNNDKLYAYGFYIAPLAAFFAITFPDNNFTETNIFYLHNIGYYFTHVIIIIDGILLVTLGIFRPNFKTAVFLNLIVVVLSAVIFGFNCFVRHFIGSPANYFYTYEHQDISILKLFWSIVPIRYLFAIFAMFILNAFIVIVTLPFYFKDKKKAKMKMVA